MSLPQGYELRVLCHVNLRGQIGLIPGVAFVGFPKAVQPLQCDSSLEFIQPSTCSSEHDHIHRAERGMKWA